MPLRRAAHAVWDCQYHLVWTPKRRRPVLRGAVGVRVAALFREIGEAYDIVIEELHVAEDHVHIYCAFPPRLSVSQAVTRLKSLSARAVFREFPELRQRLWGGSLWEDGYFVRTVGDALTGEVIKRYIRRHGGNSGNSGDGDSDVAGVLGADTLTLGAAGSPAEDAGQARQLDLF